jgi:hypothetical protein
MATDKKQLNPVWVAAKPFVNGGLSGMMSTVVIQPIDMVKVRIQLGDKGNPVSEWRPGDIRDFCVRCVVWEVASMTLGWGGAAALLLAGLAGACVYGC